MSMKSRLSRVEEELAPEPETCKTCGGIRRIVYADEPESQQAYLACGALPFVIEVIRPAVEAALS